MARLFRGLLRAVGWLVLVALVGVLVLSGWTYLYFRRARGTFSTPADTPSIPFFLPVQTLRVETGDGVFLQGWLIEQERPAPVVWIIPDWKETLNDWFPVVSVLYDWGYAVVFFNLRGHPPSQGEFRPERRLVQDVQELMTHLTVRRDLEPRWAVLGHGLGAYLALHALCYNPYIRLLILEDPVPSPLERLYLPIEQRWSIDLSRLDFWWRWHYRLVYFTTPDAFAPWSCVDRLVEHRPHTVVFRSDEVMSSHAVQVYDRLPEPKEMMTITWLVTHALTDAQLRRYQNLLQRLLQRYLAEPGTTLQYPDSAR